MPIILVNNLNTPFSLVSMAGLQAGLWASLEQLDTLRSSGGQEFTRSQAWPGDQEFRRWLEACRRFCNWKATEKL